MVTQAKKRKPRAIYIGEPIPDNICFNWRAHPDARTAVDELFDEEANEFLRWLACEIAFVGPVVVSRKNGPTAAGVKSELKALSAQARQFIEALPSPSDLTYAALVALEYKRGGLFDDIPLREALGRFINVLNEAEEGMTSAEKKKGRKAYDTDLLDLATSIAKRMKDVGSPPSMTATGKFVALLRLVLDTIGLEIDPAHLARRVLASS